MRHRVIGLWRLPVCVLRGGEIHEEQQFCTYVNPERSLSQEASRINGISDKDLLNAPLIVNVLPEFLEFAAGSILVAHNAEFDLSFLEAEKEMCWGYIEIPECLCTMNLSRTLHPHEYRHNLETVAGRLKLPLPDLRHRALPDVLLTAQVLLKLIKVGHVQSLEELREKAAPKVISWR